MLSHFSREQLFVIPRAVDCHALLSMGFSRQKYWSGLPCPSPMDLPNPGIEPMSLMSPALAGEFFTTSATWEALKRLLSYNEVIKLNYEVIKMGFPGGSDSKESACREGGLVQSLGWEDPLDEGMATHCSILPEESPWMEDTGRLHPWGYRVRHY